MSSTTKVITDFDEFKNETDREEFRYVVPDFRFNKRFDRLSTLSEGQKKKTEVSLSMNVVISDVPTEKML